MATDHTVELEQWAIEMCGASDFTGEERHRILEAGPLAANEQGSDDVEVVTRTLASASSVVIRARISR